MNAEKGVIFVASGKKFEQEVLQAARSVKQNMPELPIALFTDNGDYSNDLFQKIFKIPNPRYNFADKIYPILNSPFEKTLYLDTDTWICDRLDDVFEVLDTYDIALAHAPVRHGEYSYCCPECFPHFNAGVIAYNKNIAVQKTFIIWEEYYQAQILKYPERIDDQESLRRALYFSTLRIMVLPPEYNLRTIFPGFVGGGVYVKIIHGRHKNPAGMIQKLNDSRRPRIYISKLTQFSKLIILTKTGYFFSKFLLTLLAFVYRKSNDLRSF